MSRKIRAGGLVTQIEFDGGTATADVALDIVSPTDGALIDEVIFTVKTAGVGTGTYDLLIEELGGSVALTGLLAAADADAAAGTVLGSVAGVGVPVDAKGTQLQVQVTENGTVSTGTKILCSIFWLG